MAFRPRSSTAVADQLPVDNVRRLDDDEAFAPLRAMEAAIRIALLDRQRRIELHHLDAELARPTTSAHGPRIALLRERAELLRHETEKAEPPAEDGGLPLPLQRALQIAAGAEVAEAPDHSKRLARLQTEVRILEQGLTPVVQQMEQIREERSLEIAQRLRPAHIEVMRTIWQAAVALSAACDRERELFAQPIINGYTARPDVLMRPGLRSAGMLGSQSEWDSEISHLRRRLEGQGVLP